jgi:hypothetical protein
VTDPRGIKHCVGRGQILRSERAVFGFPFSYGSQPILDRKRVSRRLVQPGRKADPSPLSGLLGGLRHRLLKGYGELSCCHAKMVAPYSYQCW